MEASLIFEDQLKEEILEFVEDREEPFDVEFLVKRCLQPVSEIRIRDALCELIEEGKIIRLNDNYYLSTRVLMRRWLKQKIRSLEDSIVFDELELPRNLIRQIARLLKERPELGYVDVADFVRDAIRRALPHLRRL